MDLKSILIVEDEDSIRTLFNRYALLLGFKQIIPCSNGAEALTFWEKSPDFDAIVTDFKMPGEINGVQLARIIKSNILRKTPRIVLVTAHDNIECDPSIDYILHKPVNLAQFKIALGIPS